MNDRVKYMLTVLFLVAQMVPLHAANPVIHSVIPNQNTVPKYEKFELTVNLSATYNTPWDFEQVNLVCIFTSPAGQVYTIDGFHFQDFTMSQPDVLVPSGNPVWKVRFSPDQTGTWFYVLSLTDTQGSTTYPTQQFSCVGSAHKGFIKRDGDRLEYDSGEAFFGIGTNLAWVEWANGFTIYEDWFEELEANGGNFTKITLAPWIFDFEWKETGAGHYTERQNRAWALDWVFDKLLDSRVYCQFNLMVHSVLRTDETPGWADNPYNWTNGGPNNEPADFLVNNTSKSLYKRKIRYINARWGYSPYLHSWEILSEADNTGIYNDHYNETYSWLSEMSEFIKNIDKYNRPVSTGYAIPQHDPNYWNNNAVDFTQTHLYDFIPDLEMKIYNFSKWYIDKYNKPHNVGEFALGHDPVMIENMDPNGIAFHNTLWTSAFSEAFSTALSWWWNNYLYPNGFFSFFEPVSAFFSQTGIKPSQYEAYTPLATSQNYTEIEIDPDYNNSTTKAPDNNFILEPSGYLSPIQTRLGNFLYGSFNNNLKNPPAFIVNYTKPGQFKVKTDDFVFLANLRIILDGVTVKDVSAAANHIYSIEVPVGEHEIQVKNTGIGVMEIDKYIFENYSPLLRVFALRNNNNVGAWFQNRNYNWEYLGQNGTPSPISEGIIRIDNLDAGVYRVDWYNGSAVLDSSQYLAVNSNELILESPAIIRDGLFEVSYHSTLEPDFAATPVIGDAPLTVQFSDQTNSFGATINSWLWDFGDGQTSSQQNPENTYVNTGTYSVTLTVSSGQYQESITKTDLITVEQPLVAEFTGDPIIILPGESVQFTDQSLGNPQSWMWMFGDNSFSFTPNPGHVYNQPGNYDISLLIQKGNKSDITIKNDYIQVLVPLVANFSADTLLTLPGDEIQFTDLSQGTPQNWFWDFGDGNSSNQQNPLYDYSNPGTYSVKLVVSTEFQQDSVIRENHITILEPLVADFTADTTLLWTGQQVGFSDASQGNPDSWQWDLGDGNSSTLQNPVHFYEASGQYSVSLQVSDTIQTSEETKTNFIKVRDTLDAEFTVDTTIVVKGNKVYFTDQSKGNPESWFWFFGDGFYSLKQNPSHLFKYAGQFTVSLEISRNDSTDTEVRENFVEVLKPLIADFSADTMLAFPEQNIQFWDNSSGDPTGWFWSFDNFSNSTEQNPITSYDEPGTYTIQLKVFTQHQEDSTVKENYITILEPLVADFTANPTTVQMGQPVQFSDLSAGNPDQWMWLPGNNDTSYLQNPSTTYYEDGNYSVSLIIENQYGIDTLTRYNFIYVLPPTYSHVIPLNEGWSGISSFVSPVFPGIEKIFSGIEDEVRFAVNEQGVYWPDMNINTIGDWNPSMGLTIDMKTDAQITIEGYQTLDNPVDMVQGWNIFPVLRSCPLASESLGSILENEMVLVKETAGWKIYWPAMNISSLDTLRPGNAYLIYMNQQASFSFPACD